MIIKNTKYSVLTPSGYKSFDGIKSTNVTSSLTFMYENGTSISCSENHRFIVNSTEVYASDLRTGDVVVSTSGDLEIIDITKNSDSCELFDIVGVTDGNIFFVNDILSHNCDTDFVSSGATLIEGDLLKWYSDTTVKDPVEMRGFDKNIWIWEYADYTKQYVVSADVARGDGKDYSAFHVLDVETLTQVAEYKGQIGTTEFGHMLIAIASEYNNALLVVENANVGWATIQPIIDNNYENLFYSANDLTVVDVHAQLAKGYDLKDKNSMKPGFSTTTRTRPLLISKLETVMRERVLTIRSKRLMSELNVFIWKGERAEAQAGKNDDLVMSMAIGLWVRDTTFKLRQQGLDLTRMTLDRIGKSQPMIISTGAAKQTGWSMNTGNGQQEDLSWLL